METILITAALTAAQIAIGAMRKIEGPRLEDLKVTVADYGTPLNYFYGVRRFEGVPVFWAEEITEEKKSGKGKGGKTTTYKYSCSWAVAVADHEIDGVTRIWFDKHLVYDLTGAGPVTPFKLGKKFSIRDALRVYNGTETQEADERMVADVESREGAGSCPAYRGVAYIVFEDIPLEKVGNRIPQITVEAVASGTAAYPYDVRGTSLPKPEDLYGFTFSPDFSRFGFNSGSDYEIWDVAARQVMIAATFPASAYGLNSGWGVANDGTIFIANTSNDIVALSSDGIGLGATIAASNAVGCTVKGDLDGTVQFLCIYQGTTNQYIEYQDLESDVFASVDTADISPETWTVTAYVADGYGSIWAVGAHQEAFTDADTIYFYRLYDSGENPGSPGYGACSGFSLGAVPTIRALHSADGGHFVVYDGSDVLYAIDDETFTVTDSLSGIGIQQGAKFDNHPQGSEYLWLDFTEIDLGSLTVLRTLSLASWGHANGGAGIYDPINHAIITTPTGGGGADELYFNYLDRLGPDAVTLRTIFEDVCTRCGVLSANVDATDLTQAIDGWSWTQGPGKDIILPLLDVHDSDARPHNFQLQGIRRGGASAGTIDVGEFVREGEDTRYTITIAQDTDLPRRATLNFADVDADQQVNSVVVQRPLDSVDGVRETTYDLGTLAMSATVARQLAERVFRRIWNERESYSFALTAQRMAVEPGDVYTPVFDGVSRIARCTKLTFSATDGLVTEWVRDDPSLASLSGTTGAAMDGRVEQTIQVPLISKGFILDIPLIRDADNDTNPLLYYAAAPYASGTWPGAVIYQGDGTDYTTEIGSVASAANATWGYATDALPDASCAVWDRGNSVNIRVQNGTLASTTEAICNATPTFNLALLGSELIQFTTATLEGDGTYTLSGLKRGRRGTERATSIHAVGDQFVLLDAAGNVEMGASDIGDTLYFKAVTAGREIDSAFPITIDPYVGATNKPYNPAHFEAVKDSGTGDWTFTWVRRSRIGGAWTSGTSIPLGESAENYKVKIMDGVTVVRTITSTTATAVYSSAQQVTDGGDVPEGDLDATVLQVGDLMDGYETAASF
jgi:hypothetical protein